jgi:hypothetical protein
MLACQQLQMNGGWSGNNCCYDPMNFDWTYGNLRLQITEANIVMSFIDVALGRYTDVPCPAMVCSVPPHTAIAMSATGSLLQRY